MIFHVEPSIVCLDYVNYLMYASPTESELSCCLLVNSLVPGKCGSNFKSMNFQEYTE